MRVILNADDLGLSTPINDAVLDALARRRATSTSLLATGPAFDDAIAGLEQLRDPCVGVHLDLTEGEPLTDGLGPFLSDGRLSAEAWKAGPAHHDAIVAEWTAQVQRVIGAGIHPTHLDTHQHVHFQAPLVAALRAVAEAFGIRKVRPMGIYRPEVSRLRALPHRIRAEIYNARLRRWAQTPTGFGSVSVLRDLLDRGVPIGTFEAMAHPGNPAHPRYAEEMAWLEAHADGISRIAWRDL